jgi:hypothetical protein
MKKVTEILQKSDESPAHFYERLCEAYRLYHLYSPFNSKVPKNQQMINVTFAEEAQGNIKRKLRKLEGFASINASQLVEWQPRCLLSKTRKLKRRQNER